MQLIWFDREKGRVGAGVVLCALLVIGAPSKGSAQQPVPGPLQPPTSPTPGPTSQIAAYRPPALALVQPAVGGSVPQDRPVVVFRFAPGEPGDAIDARTFVATVDGRDRSALFQVAGGEAWGPLSVTPNDGRSGLILGPHQIWARICSVRGTCGEVNATITVAPVANPANAPVAERKNTLIDFLLSAARKLLNP
jgi:hypothetical protein